MDPLGVLESWRQLIPLQKHNVFMRVEDPLIQKAVGEKDPIAVMSKLREMKNAM